MKKTQYNLPALLISVLLCTQSSAATPYDDKTTLQNHFIHQFSVTSLDDFAQGASLFNREKSPTQNHHDALVAEGKLLFHQSSQGKKSLATCFRNAGIGIATDFPSIDILSGNIRTLPLEINICRSSNGDSSFDLNGRTMHSLLAYLYDNSAGNRINVVIPDDERSLAHYNEGKRFFYARRGQLNMACAHCHIDHAGKRLGKSYIPAVLGITSRQPMYDNANQQPLTLHQQFSQCMQRMGAKPLASQSDEYRRLELFLGYMNNGLPLAGQREARE